MKRLGLCLLLALAPACTTTAQWENQLDQYRKHGQPNRTGNGKPDLRTNEGKMSAELAAATAQVTAELALRGLFIFLATR